ncbi:MAG: hypothetical protein WC397_02930 [Candidatus Paceibacterota bacterium]|jgi:hypothetical protein
MDPLQDSKNLFQDIRSKKEEQNRQIKQKAKEIAVFVLLLIFKTFILPWLYKKFLEFCSRQPAIRKFTQKFNKDIEDRS